MNTVIRERLGRNDQAGQWVSVQGIELYCERYGAGEPLILLHGNGGDLTTWAAQIDVFAQTYEVIALDSRAHGRSTGAPESLSYRRMAADVDALLSALGLESVRVVGWSDGGIIGLLLAMEFPQRVKALAISGANIRIDQEALTQDMIDDVNRAAAGPSGRDQQLARLMATEPTLEYEAMAAVTCPTLVMAGDQDLIRVEHTVKIFQSLPRGELAIFPHADHGFFLSQPEPFNSMVLDFLKRAGDGFTSS